MKYYAVRVGAKTGIFESWEEVKPLVIGFAKAEYKSFSDKDLAQSYLDGNDIQRLMPENEYPIVSENPLSKNSMLCLVKTECINGEAKVGILIIKGASRDEHLLFFRSTIPLFTRSGVLGSNILGTILGIKTCTCLQSTDTLDLTLHIGDPAIDKFISGSWKAKTEVTQHLCSSVGNLSHEFNLNLDFKGLSSCKYLSRLTAGLKNPHTYYNDVSNFTLPFHSSPI